MWGEVVPEIARKAAKVREMQQPILGQAKKKPAIREIHKVTNFVLDSYID